ncbi:hypothetical protein KL86DYS1_30573 [uncultured Dysgonomonas sp.]|uniref:Uncharacterized protein n=1 Tax=uncultured Dysgonomonas sp. TaxID=206096 RepID=A0A212JVP4_9BACT|nr:hypothetical protein KL86DYS1_30573 [uncultured Dysgonomonas sp.]
MGFYLDYSNVNMDNDCNYYSIIGGEDVLVCSVRILRIL